MLDRWRMYVETMISQFREMQVPYGFNVRRFALLVGKQRTATALKGLIMEEKFYVPCSFSTMASANLIRKPSSV